MVSFRHFYLIAIVSIAVASKIKISNDDVASSYRSRDKKIQEIMDGMSLMGKIGQMTQVEYFAKINEMRSTFSNTSLMELRSL